MKTKKTIIKIIWYLGMALGSLVFALPFFWMFFAAFKTPQQSAQYPPTLLPNPWSINGFIEGFRGGLFGNYFLNTIIITVLKVTGTLASASLVAFGFAKLRARFKNVLFTVLLSTMMIPSSVTLIPSFVLYANLKLTNTFVPLVLPAFLGGGAFYIFLLRQFFESLPNEIMEAGMIDGCSYFSIFYKIYLPNAKPAMLTVAIFAFVNSWNDFLDPMIYLNDPDKFTISIGLKAFQSQYSTAVDTAPMMAMSFITVLPILILFVFAQKYFIRGIVTSGIK